MENFKGMVRDTLPSKNPEGTWHYGKNMLLNKGFKSVTNEDGLQFQYLVEGTIIGFIATNKDVVYFSKKENYDEIGVVNTDNDIPIYTPIIRSSLFNFQYNCPIEGIFIYNYRQELIIAWCDGIKNNSNPPYILNINNISLALNPDKTLINNLEFTKLLMFPNLKEGDISISLLDGSGMDFDSVSITYAYVYDDDTVSTFFDSHVFSILKEGITFIKNKAITLTINNLDTNFNKLKLGIVTKKDGILQGFISSNYFYNSNSFETSIENLDNFEEVNAEEIIVPNLNVSKVKTITKQNNQVFLGNIKTEEFINFQSYANQLVLESFVHTSEDYTLPSFMPNEVYSFYIELQTLNGNYTPAFHIPGRQAVGDELNLIQESDRDTYRFGDWAIGLKRFRVINTIHNTFGYWENEENYPNTSDFSNIGGTGKIRYHRFPSLDYTGYNYNNNNYPRLGVKLTNIETIINTLPSNIRNNIQGYRLSFVQRNGKNSRVVGNFDLINVQTESRFFNDAAYRNIYKPFLITGISDTITFTRPAIIGLDVFKETPTLDLDFVELNHITESFIRITSNNGTVNDDTSQLTISKSFNNLLFKYVKINNIEYLPENNIASGTNKGHNTVLLNLDLNSHFAFFNYFFPSGPGGVLREDVDGVLLDATGYSNKSILYTGFNASNLITVGKKSSFINNTEFIAGDVYGGRSLKTVISSVGYVQGSNVDYGIVFKNMYHKTKFTAFPFIGTEEKSLPTNNTPINLNNGGQGDVNYINNFNFKHIITGQNLTPINNINSITTYNPFSNYIVDFPFRIQKGLKIQNENLDNRALRTFLANNYYEMPNDKGEIIALRGNDRLLYIQQRFSLYLASIKDVLITENVDAFLGEGTLFDREPTEILGDSKGTIGSNSQFSSIIIKGNYITVNQITGQIFIINSNSVKEISAKGNKNWFWNNWDNGLDYFEIDNNNEKRRIDNPYVSVGHLVGYDKEYNRLLFIKKYYKFIGDINTVIFDGEFYYNSISNDIIDFKNTDYFINKSKTLSYNLEGEGMWSFEHDYFPNIIYHTHDKLFSINTSLTGVERSKVYLHNDKINKGLYYDNKFESYIDLIFNQNLTITKLYDSIIWYSSVLNNNNGEEENKTINKILLYNDHQCSGIIDLSNSNLKKQDRVWNFNKFKDLIINSNFPIINDDGDLIESNINNNKVWFEKSNFISKFITIRLIIDNIDNDDIYIHKVNVKSKIINR